VLKRQNVTSILLQTIGAAGLLTVAVLAPNALQAFGFLAKKEKRFRKWQTVNTALSRLVTRGFIVVTDTPAGKRLRLTEAGEKFWRKNQILKEGLPKKKQWDEKWRILIFDIPEKRKGLREKVRKTLLDLGFIRLQDSVWVYPYDCSAYILLLKADFKIGKDLLYLVVEKLENDRNIRKQFGLLIN
jgi:DNA-binding transcriptional regulator PaaX